MRKKFATEGHLFWIQTNPVVIEARLLNLFWVFLTRFPSVELKGHLQGFRVIIIISASFKKGLLKLSTHGCVSLKGGNSCDKLAVCCFPLFLMTFQCLGPFSHTWLAFSYLISNNIKFIDLLSIILQWQIKTRFSCSLAMSSHQRIIFILSVRVTFFLQNKYICLALKNDLLMLICLYLIYVVDTGIGISLLPCCDIGSLVTN